MNQFYGNSTGHCQIRKNLERLGKIWQTEAEFGRSEFPKPLIFLDVPGFEGFRHEEASFDEYVTNTLKHKSIIVDADDLQKDSGKCQFIQIRLFFTLL